MGRETNIDDLQAKQAAKKAAQVARQAAKKPPVSSKGFDPVASGSAILARAKVEAERTAETKAKAIRGAKPAIAESDIAKPDTGAKSDIAKPDTGAKSAIAKSDIAKSDIAKSDIAKPDMGAKPAIADLKEDSLPLKIPALFRDLLKHTARSDLTLREMRVYIYLLSISKKTGVQSEYSNQQIEKSTGVHRSHISKAMNGLVKQGLIEKEVRNDKNRFSLQTNLI